MRADEFESAVRAMIGNGYSPLQIAHGEKFPGYITSGKPQPAKGWDRWCSEQPNEHVIASWVRGIGGGETGLGAACGRGLVCIDIDADACMNAIQNALPPAVVSKRAAKGISLFFKGNTSTIRSMPFDAAGGGRLVDLLSTGRQSVLPNSLHPNGMFYQWVSEDTLFDTPIDHLTELPNDIAKRIGEVLKQFGYDPDHERSTTLRAATPTPISTIVRSAGGSDTALLFRAVNDTALANLHAWVPKLGLRRYYRAGGGYKAVAEWRRSGSGRDFARRNANLSFTSEGIRDFGDDRGYSPIDVVVAARGLALSEALEWLADCVGVETHPRDTEAEALAERLIANANRKVSSR